MNPRPKWKKQIGEYFIKFQFNFYQDKKERKKGKRLVRNILEIKRIKKYPLGTKLGKH